MWKPEKHEFIQYMLIRLAHTGPTSGVMLFCFHEKLSVAASMKAAAA